MGKLLQSTIPPASPPLLPYTYLLHYSANLLRQCITTILNDFSSYTIIQPDLLFFQTPNYFHHFLPNWYIYLLIRHILTFNVSGLIITPRLLYSSFFPMTISSKCPFYLFSMGFLSQVRLPSLSLQDIARGLNLFLSLLIF